MYFIVKVQGWVQGDATDLSCSKTGGRKVTGEGFSYAPLCHSITECSPSPLQYIYMLWFPTGWLPRERPCFRPHPGLPFLPETQKAVSSAVDTQHRLISQSITHQPYFPCFRP